MRKNEVPAPGEGREMRGASAHARRVSIAPAAPVLTRRKWRRVRTDITVRCRRNKSGRHALTRFAAAARFCRFRAERNGVGKAPALCAAAVLRRRAAKAKFEVPCMWIFMSGNPLAWLAVPGPGTASLRPRSGPVTRSAVAWPSSQVPRTGVFAQSAVELLKAGRAHVEPNSNR